jgi:two-component system cell cycle response regulator DivK
MKEKVLIVEDNVVNMKLLQATLEPYGYTLITTTDGQEALEKAVQERPDLIVMDIQLPKMSGVEVVKRLRQMPEFRQTPIIALTAYAMKGDEERLIEAGFDVYLPKPVNTRELPRIISGMLEKRGRKQT